MLIPIPQMGIPVGVIPADIRLTWPCLGHKMPIERGPTLMAATTFFHHRSRGTIALVGVVLIEVVGGALWLHKFRKVPAPPTHIVLLTNYPGHQRNPSFSPDGNRIAFVWDGEEQDNYDIYVKQIGRERALRLTTDPATDDDPAWSPDGRYIAFCRYRVKGKEEIRIVPAAGGSERKLLTRCAYVGGPFGWSPDGKYLAYDDCTTKYGPQTLFMLAVDNPEDKRPLTAFVGQTMEGGPQFSPDGKMVAFVRMDGGRDIFLVPASGGEPKRLTFDNAQFWDLNWTPDGAYILFASDRLGGRPRLWKVRASGGQPEPLSVGKDAASDYALSRDGHRLAYSYWEIESNIWRYQVPATGGPSSPPTKWIASAGRDESPQFSRDGKRVAFVSARSGSREIWVCDSDGSNLRQLTFLAGRSGTAPRWSPDGREIAFQSPDIVGAPIYVASAEGGEPRRLTTGRQKVAGPCWSRDGRWIYFGSDRTGPWQVWKMPSKGGPAVQVTKKGGTGGSESPDGKTLYYAKGLTVRGLFRVRGLWKVPVEGGKETPVLKQFWAGFFDTWCVAREGIYFYNVDTDTIDFFTFATRQTTQIAKPEKRGGPLTVSPDGRWILFSQVDVDTSHIMMVENFRW